MPKMVKSFTCLLCGEKPCRPYISMPKQDNVSSMKKWLVVIIQRTETTKNKFKHNHNVQKHTSKSKGGQLSIVSLQTVNLRWMNFIRYTKQ